VKHDVNREAGKELAQPRGEAEDETLGMKPVTDKLEANAIGLKLVNGGAGEAESFRPIETAREPDK